jgi:hypothetical protein
MINEQAVAEQAVADQRYIRALKPICLSHDRLNRPMPRCQHLARKESKAGVKLSGSSGYYPNDGITE